MKCDKTKKIVSLVLLLAAVLIYFLTEWPIWIPIVLLVLAIIRFFCKAKCKICSPQEGKEEKPVEETPVEEVETEKPVEETPVEEVETEKPVEETPVEEVETEKPVEETPVEEEVEEKKEEV